MPNITPERRARCFAAAAFSAAQILQSLEPIAAALLAYHPCREENEPELILMFASARHIVANNSPSGLDGGAVITGANNLIRISSVPVPDMTKTAEPKLLPLACHGGADSPAIDAGNSFLANDQRGPGFARSIGARADIGAYEFDPDRIFADGLDCG